MINTVKKITFILLLTSTLCIFEEFSYAANLMDIQNKTKKVYHLTDYEQHLAIDYLAPNFKGYDFFERKVLDKYSDIAKRNNKKLIIKTNSQNLVFVNNGNGDNGQTYRFIGLLTKNIAIVYHTGYEEGRYYFISLQTGHIILELPPIDGAISEVSLSPDESTIAVITANSIYDQNPYYTQFEIFELTENLSNNNENIIQDEELGITYNRITPKLSLSIEETDYRKRSYTVTWTNNSAIRIQSSAPYKGYIDFYKNVEEWLIKDKKLLQFLPTLNTTNQAMDSKLKESRPYNWKVRAFYSDELGLYLFDKKGNILIDGNNEDRSYVIELFQANNKSLWHGNANVYYAFNPKKDEGYDNILTDLSKIFIASAGNFCPAIQIASDQYHILNTKHKELFLNGYCARATQEKVGKHVFWTYPLIDENSTPVYWTVQYFSDPIKPMYSTDGTCLLYCDANKDE